MPITIRQATLADLDDIAAIEAQCFPQAEAATRESLADRLSAYPQSFLIAESDGQPVGFINGCVTNAPTIDDDMFSDTACHNPQGCYQAIFGLDVLPDYRRQGIAAKMCIRDRSPPRRPAPKSPPADRAA